MSRRSTFSVGSTLAAALLCGVTAAAAEHGDADFGWAMSPPSWPNASDPGVRGKERYVPYYPGYCRHAHKLFHFLSHGVCGGVGGMGWEDSWPTTDTPSGDYGIYTGGPRDEDILLHLGGNGPFRPTMSGPDIIDAIQGPAGVLPH